jgi:flagellar protein FlgJ
MVDLSSAYPVAREPQAPVSMPARNTLALDDESTVLTSSRESSVVNSGGSENEEQSERAVDVAKQFEALLVHSLLKNMRKTTFAENTSNERALYDDMMDEQIANTIVESGGLGIADHIARQLQANTTQPDKAAQTSTNRIDQVLHDRQQLRDIAQHIKARALPDTGSSQTGALFSSASDTTDITRLRMATELWSAAPTVTELPSGHQEFIRNLMPHAQQGAQRLGTSPEVLLAIAALETGWGQFMITSESGQNSHNLFGIKASASDSSYALTKTTEYIEGSAQKINARFKMFNNNADAVNGFTDFLFDNPRYKNALSHAAEPERFVKALQEAGYATDPHYANKVISIMREIKQQPLPL